METAFARLIPDPVKGRVLTVSDWDRIVAEGRSPFFVWLAAALLAIVIAGFGKSFFLRSGFTNFPVAPIVLVHGAVMTAWFAVFLIQTSLVRVRRVVIHRALGLVSVGLAAVMVATMIPTTYGFPGRRFVAEVPGYDFTADLMHITMVVHGNTAMLVQFVIFYSAGMIWRHRRSVHSRLMSFAAIAVVTPASSRLGTLWGPAGETSELFGIISAFCLPLVVAAYDWSLARRLHLVTVLGIGLIYGSLGVCGLIGRSPVGSIIVEWLISH